MKQTDFLNMGKEAFFNTLPHSTASRLIDLWKRTVDPNGNNDENEALCEIFCDATHVIPNSLEICTPLHNTDRDVDFFKVTFERQAEAKDIDIEEIAKLLMRVYDTIFETGKHIKETTAPIKDNGIYFFPLRISHP